NLTKTGAGVLALSGANTYGGTTTVSAGTLRAVDGVGLSSSTNLSINGGIFESSANLTRTLGTGAGSIQIPGGSSGFNANGADIRFTTLNGGPPVQWGSAAFAPTTLVLNSGTTNNVTLAADIDLNGAARTVQVSNNTATFSGVVSDSVGSGAVLTKTGGG